MSKSSWYYAHNGTQVGPVTIEELKSLIAEKTLAPGTLVWSAGMENWQPLENVPELMPVTQSPGEPNEPPYLLKSTLSPKLVKGPKQPAAESGVQMVQCSHCGSSVPLSEVINYQGQLICAACKDAFFQGVREGIAAESWRIAGMGERFLAYIIDNLIMTLASFVCNYVGLFVLNLLLSEGDAVYAASLFFSFAFGFLLPTFYEAYFLSRPRGATPGKMVLGLKVVDANGNTLTFWRGAVRYPAKLLSGMICSIGYLMAFFNDEHKALHDMICGTYVINK